MFAYCNNNPIICADPTGFRIVLSSNATDEQIEEYKKAIEYLKKSSTAKKIIEALENSPVVFTIEFIDDNSPYYEPATRTIYFDTNCGLIMKDKKSVMSPALSLAHEMGHAFQHLLGVLEDNQDNVYMIEQANLEACEIPIAKELGEPTRVDYYDACGVMDMQSSTHYRTKRLLWWLNPFNWFKPSADIIDHYN